jgi:hypothetical protein
MSDGGAPVLSRPRGVTERALRAVSVALCADPFAWKEE